MSKLIEQAKANPTPKTLERVRVYLLKHPFAACLATDEERAWLISVGFSI